MTDPVMTSGISQSGAASKLGNSFWEGNTSGLNVPYLSPTPGEFPIVACSPFAVVKLREADFSDAHRQSSIPFTLVLQPGEYRIYKFS